MAKKSLMDVDLVGVLKSLANRYRGRVSEVNLHDPNVSTSTLDWRDAFERRPVPADRFRHRVKAKRGGHPIEIYSSNRFIAVSAFGSIRSIPFSINRPDRVVMLRRSCQVPNLKEWRVYVGTDVGVPPALRRRDVLELIGRLALGRQDSLHVHRSGLTVYLRPAWTDRVVDVIAVVASLATVLGARDEPAPEFTDLPAKFRPLVRLMRTWSTTDDQARSDRMASASRERLQRLVNEVAPHFRSINAYLDGFREGAISETAAALGTLAESATEARLVLENRDRRGTGLRRRGSARRRS